jgi:hypothetical protein
MRGYNKGSLGPSITANYNGYVVFSMEGYSKGSLGPYITVHYNG